MYVYAIIVLVLTICCLVYGGTDAPQWLIALFTVVMTVAMIDQNRKFDRYRPTNSVNASSVGLLRSE